MKFIEALLSLDAIYDLKIVRYFFEIRRERRGQETTLLRANAKRIEKIRYVDLVKLSAFNLHGQVLRSGLAIIVNVRPSRERKPETDKKCTDHAGRKAADAE